MTPVSKSRWAAAGSLVAVLFAGCTAIPFLSPAESFLDPASAGPDYEVQGEYLGTNPRTGAQIIARGNGDFEAVLYEGGLPGHGWTGATRVRLDGTRAANGIVVFEGPASLKLRDGKLSGTSPDGKAITLTRIERQSPTLGAPPPKGAVVVFDGTGTERVVGVMDKDGHLEAGATSLDSFGDASIHLEFRTPFTPEGRGQARGNSGVYLQNRYEVQVLDSFGLPEADNDCGGIYKVATPRVNMSLPPLQWQTYDIDFTAARFDERGRKTTPARATVRHNGVVIHDDVVIGDSTGGGNAEGPAPGPLYLQDHWDPVVYRNVWVLPR